MAKMARTGTSEYDVSARNAQLADVSNDDFLF